MTPYIEPGTLTKSHLFNIVYAANIMAVIDMDVDASEQQVIEEFLVTHFQPEFGDLATFKKEIDAKVSDFLVPYRGKPEQRQLHKLVIGEVVNPLTQVEKVGLAGLLILVMDADGLHLPEELALLQYFLAEINQDAHNRLPLHNLQEMLEMDIHELKKEVAEKVTSFFHHLRYKPL